MEYKTTLVVVVLSFSSGFFVSKLAHYKVTQSITHQLQHVLESQEDIKISQVHEDHTIKQEHIVVYSQRLRPPSQLRTSPATSCDSTPPVVAEERTIITYSNVHDALTELGSKQAYNLTKSDETITKVTEPAGREYHLGILAYLPVVSFERPKTTNDIEIVISASRDLFLGFSGVVSYNIQRTEIGMGMQWSF
jgi:hypothetical protein